MSVQIQQGAKVKWDADPVDVRILATPRLWFSGIGLENAVTE